MKDGVFEQNQMQKDDVEDDKVEERMLRGCYANDVENSTVANMMKRITLLHKMRW